jgi:hypothetical protein
VIYLDTSVALAQLLAEDRQPPAHPWQELLVSSRLLQYELWTRIHSRRLAGTHADAVRALLGQIAFLEMVPEVLARAREPFPHGCPHPGYPAPRISPLSPVAGQSVSLATDDRRMSAAARQLGFDVFELEV